MKYANKRRAFRSGGGRFSKPPSLESLGAVKVHHEKRDGTWCGGFNTPTGHDAMMRSIFAETCSHCGEPLEIKA